MAKTPKKPKQSLAAILEAERLRTDRQEYSQRKLAQDTTAQATKQHATNFLVVLDHVWPTRAKPKLDNGDFSLAIRWDIPMPDLSLDMCSFIRQHGFMHLIEDESKRFQVNNVCISKKSSKEPELAEIKIELRSDRGFYSADNSYKHHVLPGAAQALSEAQQMNVRLQSISTTLQSLTGHELLEETVACGKQRVSVLALQAERLVKTEILDVEQEIKRLQEHFACLPNPLKALANTLNDTKNESGTES